LLIIQRSKAFQDLALYKIDILRGGSRQKYWIIKSGAMITPTTAETPKHIGNLARDKSI
jgi:hypothetical protein